MVEHFTSTPFCVSLFFLSRTKFPQKATLPLIRNSVTLQHPEQTIPDTTGFQRKLLLFFLKPTVHHSPHPTDSTEIFGCVRKCHLIGRKLLLRIVSTSRIMASFNHEQMFAEERILEGHIILTGQAGTEKSFLLRDVALTTFCSILCRFVSIKIWIIRITF